MTNEKDTKNLSKFLSLILRHDPARIGISLDANGWAYTGLLLEKMNAHGKAIDRELLQYIVDTNNKKRFAFDDTGERIRASQGHSVAIELGYEPLMPPEILFHGTAEKNLTSILDKGIVKGSRHHVHLSTDEATAINVGSRHGKPVILRVSALQMHNDGYTFFLSENGVWLTENVPANYIVK